MKIFLLNSATNKLEINVPEILTVREMAKLWNDLERNKCEEDPTGVKRYRAYREFMYIYAMIDWTSLYSDYYEQERHKEAMADSNLSEEEFVDADFRSACRKYREIQESQREYKLVKASNNLADKLIIYLDNIDPEERNPVDNKPIYKVKDIITEMNQIPELIETLKSVEQLVKKNETSGPDLKKNVVAGLEDIEISEEDEYEDDEF